MFDWLKKKILNKKCLGCVIAVILFLFLGVNIFFKINTGMWFIERAIYQPLSEEEIQKRIPNLTRHYPNIVKGNWEPNASYMHKMIRTDADELKEVGVNTVSVAAEYDFKKDGTHYMREGVEEEIRSNIILAKEEGFAIWLAVSFIGGGDIKSYEERGINVTQDEYLKASEEVALIWAETAEEFNVEYFGPQNELDCMLKTNFEDNGTTRASILAEWYKQILPKVRKTFTGKVVAKFCWVEENIPETASDYIGYDYVGMAISHGNMNLENYREHIKEQFKRIIDLTFGSNCEWMVLEAWHPFGIAMFDKNEAGESLDELQDEYYEVLTSEYLQIEEIEPSGFFFHSWIMPGSNVKGRDAEDVLKDFFSEI
jgi:hypothetical protein